MTEISRRAVLGSAVAGAAASTLPAAAAAAAPVSSAAPATSADTAGPDHGGGWVDENVDWPSFLAGSDLVWQKLPAQWYEGPYLGNGFLGSGIYAEPGQNAIR